MITGIDVLRVEENAKGRMLYSVRASTVAGRIDFPIAISERGSPTLDEAAVLRSTLEFAEQLTASVPARLGQSPAVR